MEDRHAPACRIRRLRPPCRTFLLAAVVVLALFPALAPAQPCPPADGAPGQAGQVTPCDESEPASLPPDGPARGAGNPVDLVSGAKYERRADLVFADTTVLPEAGGDLARIAALQPGLPFVFSRHFVADGRDRGLGRGWRHGFDTRLAFRKGTDPQVQILQADGRRIVFRASGAGFSSARVADGMVLPLPAGRWRWRWPGGRQLDFDAAGRLVVIRAVGGDTLVLRHIGGRLVSVRDRSGRTLHLRWRARRLVGVEGPGGASMSYGFDDRQRLVSARTGVGAVERYWYEDVADGQRLTGAGPGDDQRSRFAYDAAGRVVLSLPAGAPASAGLRFEYQVAADGRSGTTRVRSPQGVADYDWRRIGPDGAARLVAGAGQACTRCPPVGVRWHWDEAGRLAGAGRLHHRYDEAGRIVRLESRAEGSAAAHESGANLLVLESRRYGPVDGPAPGIPLEVVQPSVARGLWRRARIEIDRQGRIVTLVEQGHAPDGGPSARHLRLHYHPAPRDGGKAPSRASPDAGHAGGATDAPDILAGRLAVIERLAPDDAQRVVARLRLRYDARGWLVGAEGAGAPTHTVRRDASGAPLTVVAPAPDARVPVPGPATDPQTLVLSGHGERVRVDPLGRITREHYDDLGRLVRSEDERTGSIDYEHDALDRLVGIGWQDGTHWRYHRDDTDRPVRVVQARGAERIVTQLGWWAGRLVRVDHPVQKTDARYDSDGRLLQIEHQLLGARHWQAFAWDAAGRLVGHRLPDGSRLRHEYDAAGKARALYWTPRGGVERVLIEDAQYQGDRIASFRLGGRIGHARRFDADRRLVQLAWSGREDYPRWYYTWQQGNRLSGIDSPAASRRFAWDRHGRLLVDELHRPGVPVARQFFAWNAAGDPLALRDEDGQTRLVDLPGNPRTSGLPARHRGLDLDYNAQRRIATVRAAGRVLVRNQYNGLGERAVREAGGTRQGYLYHRRQLLAETDGAGRLQRTWLRWQGQVIGFLEHRPGATPLLRFVLGDHLGSPAMVTDDEGNPLWRGRITASGLLVDAQGDIDQPLRLPGQVADPETGLSDNYQRTYDPLSARYLEPDPLGAAGGHNAYAYADGNPVSGADPLGLILFAFDGTGYTEASRSNVWLMAEQYRDYDAYDKHAEVEPDTFYVPGVGTQGGLADNIIVGGILAIELEDRVMLQLERLDGYVQGRYGYYVDAGATIGPDTPLRFDLDVVGFSRGAAAARDFANRVMRRRAAGYYRELVGGGCVTIEIRFMGLFDTVLSTHIGSFELGIPAEVGYVASAVAANEYRRRFPLDSIAASASEGAATRRRTEVAFVGGHGDIGGYACVPGTGCHPGDLSTIALLWMRKQAASRGVVLRELTPEESRIRRPVVHDETSTWLYFDPDPPPRRVLYHAPTRFDPVDEVDSGVLPEPDRPAPAAPVEMLTAERALEFVRVDAVQRPGRVGIVDLEIYAPWLRRNLGLEIDTGHQLPDEPDPPPGPEVTPESIYWP